MNDQLGELLHNLPKYLGGHMLLSATALGVGLLFSLPLGILVSRRRKLTELTLGVAGIIQTVPSLALLALMVIVLRGLIGFWPAFIALTLYSILPILANTVLGIKGVDPILIEAGRGLGMYGAVAADQVDVIAAYTSDGRIPYYELEVLRDPEGALPPYDAVLLLSPEAAKRPQFVTALRSVVGTVSLDAMRQANLRVDVEKWPARRAAAELYGMPGPSR
jgi:Substrate binding domain of ABC-type glycine betaine transport system